VSEFSVRIEPHGRTLKVAAGQSVLTAALAAGLNLPHSCKSGHCSSCRAHLLAGAVHYPNGPPLGLSAAEAAAGEVLLCQAQPASPLTVQARLIASVGEVEIKTLPCRIAQLKRLAPDVMQVWLRLPAVEPLAFQPGQYLDVLLPGGRRRSFSIASPPHDSTLIELHVRRVSGGDFTERLFGGAEPLREGALVRIEGPIGQFIYRAGATPVIMIAGGTGFAPLKSMLRHALENGSGRRIHLYWGARQMADLYEEELLLEWFARYPQLGFTAVLSEARGVAGAHRRLGLVHEAVLADHARLDEFEVYAAGPPAMIEALRARLPQQGLPQGRLYFDSFDYAPDERR
jgi:CDP-4-dehydro-6-deoxyglucose reductase